MSAEPYTVGPGWPRVAGTFKGPNKSFFILILICNPYFNPCFNPQEVAGASKGQGDKAKQTKNKPTTPHINPQEMAGAFKGPNKAA